jgi:hypothetical protein
MDSTAPDYSQDLTAISPADLDQLPEFATPEPAELDARSILFAKWYAVVQDKKIAYERAGGTGKYAGNHGLRMLRRMHVQAYVTALRNEIVTGKAMGTVSPEWVTQRYREIAQVRLPDLMVDDEIAGPRWKRLAELTDVQRAAICKIIVSRPKVKAAKDAVAVEIEIAKPMITGYEIYPKPEALAALARIAGMNKDKVLHDHAHAHRVDGIFRFVAGRPQTSETVARLRAKHGRAGARVIEHDATPALADLRPLATLRGV